MPDRETRARAVARLVGELYSCGDWVLPTVIEGILAGGTLAIDPLVEVLSTFVQDRYVSYSGLSFAALLLGQLHAVEAIPALIEVLRKDDDDALDDVARALGTLGGPAVEPCLALIDDATLTWYQRATAIDAAVGAARGDEAQEERVRAALREQLETLVGRGEVTDDEAAIAGQIVVSLADLRRSEDLPLVEAAFSAEIVDELFVDLETARDVFSGQLESAPPTRVGDYFDTYAERYAQEVARIATLVRIAKDVPIPGRNDPCWCGSGKKYKQCHWAQDQKAHPMELPF